MTGIPLRVLIVEDSEDDAALLLRELRRGGYEPIFSRVDTREDMTAELEKGNWDIVISDYVVIPRFTGLDALKLAQEKGMDIPFIMVSGNIGEYTLVEAMKAGVHDYIVKGNWARLIPAIQREQREAVVRWKQRQADEALRRSEAEARRLAEENAVMAGIGRIISSTLNVEEVYERFAEEAKQLIPFDRIGVNIIDPERKAVTVTYVSGTPVEGLRVGDVFPLEGSLNERLMKTRSGIILHPEKYYRSGLKSIISIPLISGDQVFGTMHFSTKKPGAYTEHDLRLAERVATQIAGAMANAQLFQERKRAEEALRKSEEEAQRLARENGILAQIGQIISSTFNIEEVYKLFSEKVKKLLSFDRLAISLINPGENTIITRYVEGLPTPGRNQGDVFPVAGTFNETVIQSRQGIIIGGKSEDEILAEFPSLLANIQAGVKSILSVPLISRDQAIGVLHFRSRKENAYSKQDLKLAESIANQIAGAIANVQLYEAGIQAEAALRKSEEEARRLAQENALVAEIGRIIGSTLNIDEVFERFSKAVAKLIPFDRIVINLNSPQKDASFVRYVAGIDVPGRRVGQYVPLAGSASEECMRTKSGLLIQLEDGGEMRGRFPRLRPTFEAGIRSMIMVPLIWEDQIIGILSLRSIKMKAYTARDVKLAESIASQISGAIANAQLFAERIRAEDQIKASLKEKEVLLKEIHHRVKNNLQVISSLLNLQSRYIRDPQDLEMFRESQNRIRSMGLVHEKLYQSGDLGRIHFREYLRSLTSHLLSAYRVQSDLIRTEVAVKDVLLGVDKAIPCGLIVNELTSNAFKHAFPQGRKGKVEISLEGVPENQFLLRVADDGVGFPKDINLEKVESLGLQLVKTLTTQLEGKLEVAGGEGAEFRITFRS